MKRCAHWCLVEFTLLEVHKCLVASIMRNGGHILYSLLESYEYIIVFYGQRILQIRMHYYEYH